MTLENTESLKLQNVELSSNLAPSSALGIDNIFKEQIIIQPRKSSQKRANKSNKHYVYKKMKTQKDCDDEDCEYREVDHLH